MKIIKNTFPEYPKVAHGEAGDIVHWELIRGLFCLIRESDGKTVFSTAPVDKESRLRSNGKLPILSGIIAENKSKGHIFIME